MSRPDPIQYAERLYSAIRAANFSPMSFLVFGNAVKDGVDLRRMPRIAAEPFMRIVGEMLALEDESLEADIIDADSVVAPSLPAADDRQDVMTRPAGDHESGAMAAPPSTAQTADPLPVAPAASERRREGKKR